MSRPFTDPIPRFWSHVEIRGENECWEWQKVRHPFGHGRFFPRPGVNWLAHRYAYQITFGTIPDGMEVCHRCDNPPCCNPNHLFLGTQADNVRDMVEKGRDYRGEPLLGSSNPIAKLNEQQVVEIRSQHADGMAIRALARNYGVSQRTIQFIVRREHWKHI